MCGSFSDTCNIRLCSFPWLDSQDTNRLHVCVRYWLCPDNDLDLHVPSFAKNNCTSLWSGHSNWAGRLKQSPSQNSHLCGFCCRLFSKSEHDEWVSVWGVSFSLKYLYYSVMFPACDSVLFWASTSGNNGEGTSCTEPTRLLVPLDGVITCCFKVKSYGGWSQDYWVRFYTAFSKAGMGINKIQLIRKP